MRDWPDQHDLEARQAADRMARQLAMQGMTVANACGHWDSGGNAVRHTTCRDLPLTRCSFKEQA